LLSLSGKVLILNQSYEPVGICSPKKALVLLILSKAEMVAERKNRVVRTVNKTFPFPSVIKLNSYVRVPFKKVELSRKNILRRDGHQCQYCGKTGQDMTIDHIIPKSKGGQETWENLVTACNRCNNRKGNTTPEDAGLVLISKPRKPNHIIFMKQFVGRFEDSWRPYLFMD
jgi:5-methylcytosine-specific restriction endonuclease McrA